MLEIDIYRNKVNTHFRCGAREKVTIESRPYVYDPKVVNLIATINFMESPESRLKKQRERQGLQHVMQYV